MTEVWAGVTMQACLCQELQYWCGCRMAGSPTDAAALTRWHFPQLLHTFCPHTPKNWEDNTAKMALGHGKYEAEGFIRRADIKKDNMERAKADESSVKNDQHLNMEMWKWKDLVKCPLLQAVVVQLCCSSDLQGKTWGCQLLLKVLDAESGLTVALHGAVSPHLQQKLRPHVSPPPMETANCGLWWRCRCLPAPREAHWLTLQHSLLLPSLSAAWEVRLLPRLLVLVPSHRAGPLKFTSFFTSTQQF